MISYPDISPILLSAGPLQVRWYGVMYVLGFVAAWVLLRRLIRGGFFPVKLDQAEDFLMYLFGGMLVGARLFYWLVYYVPEPDVADAWWEPFAVWHGGLSFHGAVLGMLVVCAVFGRIYKVRFLTVCDVFALCGFAGVFFGRIGNFINAELLGRESDVPWAMRFPIRDWDGAVVGWTEARHASQLYEAVAEGLMCFAIVWLYKRYAKFPGQIAGVGIMAYGALRFVCEFFREPDADLGFYAGGLTMGQLLCGAMFLVGASVFAYATVSGRRE